MCENETRLKSTPQLHSGKIARVISHDPFSRCEDAIVCIKNELNLYDLAGIPWQIRLVSH